MSEYAPAMLMPAVAPPQQQQQIKVAPAPKPRPVPSPRPVMTKSRSVTSREDTTMYKLGLTLVVVLGMGTWVWGSMRFHKCGSGWVMAILKQLGVSLAVSIGYFAAVASIVELIRIWNASSARKTASVMFDSLTGGLTVAVLLIAVNIVIFREKCRL